MKFIIFTRSRNQMFIGRLLAVFTLLVITAACNSVAPVTSEPIDRAHLAGRWELVTGNETEWFDILPKGKFSATIRSNGFLATTLSQSKPVTLDGRWELAGNKISFLIKSSSSEVLVGQEHRYEVESLTNSSMVTLDKNGRKQTLLKAL